jgi:putative component of membrane protein insertase Oxa1/YidC/SpoIIIJ protein YidD
MNHSVYDQVVREYCLNRPLNRPNVNHKLLGGIIVFTECGLVVISIPVHRLIGCSLWNCFNVMNLLCLFLLCKPICKTAVKFYQHYASEKTRRKCQCMPSCSEYALMALDKYYWPKALWLIYRRLTHTCCLPGYKVDYP